MPKAIMISIQPKWVEKILNGEKTIEIRKKMPKCELPIDVYIYCTKGKPYCAKAYKTMQDVVSDMPNEYDLFKIKPLIFEPVNGKVVAKFILNKIDKYDVDRPIYYQNSIRKNGKYIGELQSTELEILTDSWLTNEELENYLTDKNDEIVDKFYSWHIDNLEIFDEPKELSEFEQVKYEPIPHTWIKGMKVTKKEIPVWKPITKAPQSWCYVEVE